MNTKSSHANRGSRIVRCGECGLKKLCFANNLTDREISELESIVTGHHDHPRGEQLFRTGETLNDLIIIKSGSAKTELLSETGERQVVGFHFPGDVVGLEALNAQQLPSSVIFLEPSKTCTLPIDDFDRLDMITSHLYHELIMRLSSNIVCAHEQVFTIVHHSAEQRLVIFLLDLSFRQLHRGLSGEAIHLSMTRHDIASYLGLVSTTVSRTISKFEDEGLISVHNRDIRLIDTPGLLNIIRSQSH